MRRVRTVAHRYTAASAGVQAQGLLANAWEALRGITMQNLRLLLESSYAHHPSFQCGKPALAIDADALERFVAAYDAVRQFGPRLTPAQRAACEQQCRHALAAEFRGLAVQTDDEFELAFLEALQVECQRLLLEEFKSFSAATLRDAVTFANLQNQRDALLLARDKCYFGRLPTAVVQEILGLGAAELTRCRENARQGRLTREDLSANSGAAVRRIMGVLNREFRSIGVLDAVSAYAGSRMTVTAVALELSVPQATWWGNFLEQLERPPRTLYAHLDESIAYPKSIVYLTDVHANNGPTGAYPHALDAMGLNPLQEIIGRVVGNVGNLAGSRLHAYYGKQYHQSMGSARFRAHFMRLPAELRFNSHLGWDVGPGSELETALAGAEQKMLGGPGTFIVFDGARLLHRGGMVEAGERIALQVVFSNATKASRVLGKIKRAIA